MPETYTTLVVTKVSRQARCTRPSLRGIFTILCVCVCKEATICIRGWMDVLGIFPFWKIT